MVYGFLGFAFSWFAGFSDSDFSILGVLYMAKRMLEAK